MAKLVSATVAAAALAAGLSLAVTGSRRQARTEVPRARLTGVSIVEPADPPGPAADQGAKRKPGDRLVPLRLRLAKVEGEGAKKRYVFEVVRAPEGGSAQGAVTVAPGDKPGELRYSLADGQSGSMQAGEAAVSGLAWLLPGAELDIALRLGDEGKPAGMESGFQQEHNYDMVCTEHGHYQLLENLMKDGTSYRLWHIPFGQRAQLAGYGAVGLPVRYERALEREGAERLPAAVQAGLRAMERDCESKGRALNEAYGLHAAKPADPELLGRAVAAFRAFADASGRLRDETEKALQKAVGASYSRAVTLRIRRGDNIGGETVAYRIAIDGVNRPLADYASQLPPGLLAVDARLAGESVTLQAKDLAVEALAQALAREAGGLAVRRGKTWHIVPAERTADETF